MERVVIGAVERVGLPDWKIGRLRAKVDTGARSSAVHVEDIEVRGDRVRFHLVLARDGTRRVPVEAAIVRVADVRSSNGERERRIFVRTRVRLGPVEKEVELGLAQRRPMFYRMLLGRSAMGDEFLVDPSRRYLWEHPSKKASPLQPEKRRLRHAGGVRGVKKSRGGT